MRQILTIAAKDVRLLLHDRPGLFFALIWPLLLAGFFGTIFSGSSDGAHGMGIAVVDRDHSEGSRRFVAALKGAPELNVAQVDGNEAVEQVRHGKAVAYVALAEGFGEARERMFWGEPPEIEVGFDPSRSAEAAMLEGVLTRYMFEGMQDVWTDPERMKEQLDRVRKQVEDSPEELPFEAQIFERFLTAMEELLDHSPPITEDAGVFNALSVRKTEVAFRRDGPRNAYEFTFPQGIIWGLVGCAATFGISLVVERTQGTLTRLCIAPIARWQILAGKSVACFGVTAFLATIMMIIGRLGFGVRVSSVPLLALAVFCACFGFVGIMMSLSTFGRTERSAGGIAWAVMIVLTMLGGGSVPLTFMPAWMQKLSVVSPVRWAVLALEGAIWRGFSPAEMLLPCGILIGVGLVFFALGTRAFRWVHQV